MKLPTYETPEDFRCPECGNLCEIIGDDNAFDYPGTHCTYGRSGTHYPPDWGRPVTDCCGHEIEYAGGELVIDWQEQENLAEAAFEEVEGRLWKNCKMPFAENH